VGEPAKPPAAIMVAATCARGFAPADDHLGIGLAQQSRMLALPDLGAVAVDPSLEIGRDLLAPMRKASG
jgi:hypothetical protein